MNADEYRTERLMCGKQLRPPVNKDGLDSKGGLSEIQKKLLEQKKEEYKKQNAKAPQKPEKKKNDNWQVEIPKAKLQKKSRSDSDEGGSEGY